MKRIVCISALFLSFSLFAQDKTTYDKALKTMFEVSGSEETYDTVVEQMFGMLKGQYTDVPADYWVEFKKEFQDNSMDKLVELLSPVYQKYLTLEDLEAIVAFYKTPVGVKFSKQTPLIVKESMQIGQEWGRRIGEDFIAKMKSKGFDRM